MKALILAENDNRELRPLNSRKPGALIKINGISLLEHQIRGYVKAGVKEASIAVVAGYHHDKVKRFLKRTYPAIRVVKNDDYRLMSAARSLHLALESVEIDDEALFVSSGECVYDDRVVERLFKCGASAVAGDTSRSDGESILMTNGRVSRVGAAVAKEAATATSADLWRLDAHAIQALKGITAERIVEKRDVSMATVLDDLVRAARVTLVDLAGTKWAAIRSLENLHQADKRFSRFALSDVRCFVLDMDGTVYVGDRPIRGTVEFIERNAKEFAFYFVTNNTSKLPEDYRLRLNAMGIPSESDHIITPLSPLVAYLKDYTIRNVCLLGNARLYAYLRQALPELELTADPEACEALIVAYDTELTYNKLRDAAVLLQQNPRLPFLATHGDLVCPTEHGFVPDCGCVLSVLEQTTGRKPTVVFGKPSPRLVERVTEQCGEDHMAIVGDRLYTDGKMAHNVGCRFICVLSGETTREQIDDLGEDEFPALIVRDLGELLARAS
ncbi:MAG: HAD-IIA family hydrolase [Euryarchaeota archaeon]